MINVDTHCLLCCLFLALAWSATVKRDIENDGLPSFIHCKEDIFEYSVPQLPQRPVGYSVVFDAGSSGTKLKIYSVNRTVQHLGLPQINMTYRLEFEPSMDTFINNKTGLRQYLYTMLTEVKNSIPEEYHEDTNAYLLATAGFRFLDPRDTLQLLEDIIEVFDSLKLKHFRGRETIGVLSGEEEGVYSWIAVNYLLGNFARDSPDNETVGLLEMGGGSTQIAFIPHDPIYEGAYAITIRERSYYIYAHSYLQFGMNAISKWVADVLSQLSPGKQTLENPCMLKGDNRTIQLNDEVILQLFGTSDPEYCQRILREILKSETGLKCEPKPCAIGNVYQPSIGNSKFYATQGFTYAPLALNAVGPDQVLKLDVLEQEGFKYCRQSLAEATSADVPRSKAASNCLMGIYTPTLFNRAYGFPLNTTNIRVTSTIGDDAIEWSLGIIVEDMLDTLVTRRRR